MSFELEGVCHDFLGFGYVLEWGCDQFNILGLLETMKLVLIPSFPHILHYQRLELLVAQQVIKRLIKPVFICKLCESFLIHTDDPHAELLEGIAVEEALIYVGELDVDVFDLLG